MKWMVQKPLEEEKEWYMVSQEWLARWRKHVEWSKTEEILAGETEGYSAMVEGLYDYEEEAEGPGPVDNRKLVHESEEVARADLRMPEEFRFVPRDLWHYWKEKYGVRKVGKHSGEIYRNVVRNEDGIDLDFDTIQVVELFFSERGRAVWIEVRSTDKVKRLHDEVEDRFDLKKGEYVLKAGRGMRRRVLTDGSQLAREVLEGSEVRVEVELNGGDNANMEVEPKRLRMRRGKPGLVGLGNLGNTCFMNSSIQCLSHVTPLNNYFLNKEFVTHINRDNPLGMHGELAKAWNELLQEIWGGVEDYTAPCKFKRVLERFAPQFGGYQQHDSQELLAFLMDGLHEDLNRVKDKPYVEMRDADGRPDCEAAAEAWENHLARNKSVIVDWFQGQLKSTLVCPKCQHVSVTFDPFMYLSIPVPEPTDVAVHFQMYYLRNRERPMVHAVDVPKDANVTEFYEFASERVGVPATCLRLYKSSRNRLTPVYDQQLLRTLTLSSLRLYEVEEGAMMVLLNQRLKGAQKSYYSSGSLEEAVLVPFPEQDTYTKEEIEAIVTAHVNGYMSLEGRLEVKREQHYATSDLEEEGNDLKGVELVILWESRSAYESACDKERVLLRQSPMPQKQEASTIDDCLELFSQKEVLGPDDLWYCSKCKDFIQAEKKFDIFKLPRILIIHLKRFSYQRFTSRRKIDRLVDFPLENFDLAPYVQEKGDVPLKYDLFAVSNHSGNLGFGHYTAYAKHVLNGEWYNFNDSSVSLASPSSVVSSSAYLLFYHRSDVSSIRPILSDAE